jgi:hypothetical protein
LIKTEINFDSYLGHPSVHHEIRPVDKAALVAGEKEHRLCLLDSLAEPARREVYLPAVALGLVIAQPVLQEGCAG